jgi:hypothetical protein
METNSSDRTKQDWQTLSSKERLQWRKADRLERQAVTAKGDELIGLSNAKGTKKIYDREWNVWADFAL